MRLEPIQVPTAIFAVQNAREKIIDVAITSHRSGLACRNNRVYTVKQILRNKRLASVLDDNRRNAFSLGRRTPNVTPNIYRAFYKVQNARTRELLVMTSEQAARVEPARHGNGRLPGVQTRIDFKNDGRLGRVGRVVLVFCQIVAEGDGTTEMLGVARSNALSFQRFTGQVPRIVFVHRFDDTAEQKGLGRIVRNNRFEDGQQAHLAIFKYSTIDGGIVTVSSKTVEFVNDDSLKLAGLGVVNHIEEPLAVVLRSGLCLVDIEPQERVIVDFTIRSDSLGLSLD